MLDVINLPKDFSGDFYIVAITALLPLVAGLLVLQRNPYQALIIRGMLGAIAALIYALFGAADVALTEALVGAMLSTTLYAIAIRSSSIASSSFSSASEALSFPSVPESHSAVTDQSGGQPLP